MKKIINISLIILGLSCTLFNNPTKTADNTPEDIAKLRNWWDDIFGYSPEKREKATRIINNLSAKVLTLDANRRQIQSDYQIAQARFANPNILPDIQNQQQQRRKEHDNALLGDYAIIMGVKPSNAKTAVILTTATAIAIIGSTIGDYIMGPKKKKNNEDGSL